MLEAVQAYVRDSSAALVFGLDANVHEAKDPKGKTAHYAAWVDAYAALGLSSCWGQGPLDPVQCRTTYNARTYVQPQLQKAVKRAEFLKGDCNPKVRSTRFELSGVLKSL